MKIKKIILDNIRSYENHTIEFESGSTLLAGDIGSGKTSILLGIEFALFGLQPGQRGSSLLRNRAENGKVTIEFEVEGNIIVIERSLKRGKTISQDYCAISINGCKKELSVTELKSKVLEILNYPTEFSKKQNLLYKFTVYTPQEEMKQIILEDAETRINTLRHVFGIDRYKRIIENSSIIASKLREEKRIKEAITLNFEEEKFSLISKDNSLTEKKSELVLINKILTEKQNKRKILEKERDEVLKKVEERKRLEQDFDKTRLITINKKETINNNEKQIKVLQGQISELRNIIFNSAEIEEVEVKIKNKRKEKEKLNEKILEINSKINGLNFKNDDSKKLELKISNLEICPTCLQNVEAIYRANVLNKTQADISENKNKISKLEDEKKMIVININSLNLEAINLEKRLNELNLLKMKKEGIFEKESQLRNLLSSNEPLEKDIILLTKHIESIKDLFVELSRFDNLYAVKQKEVEEALRKERLEEIKSAELRREIQVFSYQIEELKQKIKSMDEVKKELDYISELEVWISKQFIPVISHIERNVMMKLNVEFSKLFNEWFCMLVSDSFSVKLSDNFTPVIEQQDYEIDYAYLSGGERTAVALAYRLSLNQVINSLMSKIKTKDLVILDEPTDGFSEQQLDKMRDVLQELNVGQLIIVSHEQKIESFVENVIRLKKERGISVRD